MNKHEESNLWKKYLLRVAILFILLLSIPLQKGFYHILFTISWEYLIIDLFNLVTFLPHYFGENNSIYDWILFAVLSFVGAFIWLKSERGSNQESEATYFYYLRIFVRFKLASILFVAGFTKLFPIFVPEISLSHLNTAYGAFADWKHLLLSLSVAPAYLVFLGIVEVISAVLLLFRKTSFLAVIFVIPFYGNAFLADLAYQGPTYFVSVYIVLLTLPIFVYDAPRLGSLIVRLDQTIPASWLFDWSKSRWEKGRMFLKIAFSLIFILLLGIRSYSTYFLTHESLHYSAKAGIPAVEGKYNVEQFILNGDTLAYSSTDSIRWKDVVFEKWNTVSIRRVNVSFQEEQVSSFFQRRNEDRNYEYSQVGDRLYYHYDGAPDSVLVLKNPNSNYKEDGYTFHISRPDTLHLNLVGVNHQGDSLHILLGKTDKKYLLQEVKKIGRRSLGYKL